MKLTSIKKIVKECLLQDLYTRDSDWRLYCRVCEKIGLNINNITLSDIYNNPSEYPTFESVSRARRKYQSLGLYQADENVKLHRIENEKKYVKEFC